MPHDITPLMAQYSKIKRQYPDSVLLFRVGDFYETFFEDAVEVSALLNIALTTRDKKKKNPVPLAGVPFHAADHYITKLLAAGKKVAVCEQVEDPSQATGLVKREVVEVMTPGTAMNPHILKEREHNYCLSLFVDEGFVGAAIIDVSTGDLWCGEADTGSIHYTLQGMDAKEILCNAPLRGEPFRTLLEALGNPWIADSSGGRFGEKAVGEALRAQFGSRSGDRTAGLSARETAAVGALLGHCQSLRGGALPQVVDIKRLAAPAFLSLDDETIGNLELFQPLRGGDPKATLINITDHTATPMGGRQIREWLRRPLASAGQIEMRLDAVGEIHADYKLHETLRTALKRVADIRRLASRIAARKAIPREFHALQESLENVPDVAGALSAVSAPMLRTALARIRDHAKLAGTIERSIVPDPPGHLRDGGVIKRGFSPELDLLIERSEEARRWIAGLEKTERDATGISSLKVGFNKVFGYYIEVSNAHTPSIPPHYITKQTLVNSQRYYTAPLKEREELILENEDRRIECEQRIFDELCETVSREMPDLQQTSDAIAELDVLQSLATAARTFSWKRPVMDDTHVLEIIGGRHPVIEQISREAFVPNDLLLDPRERQFALITGPNMSGKSTFLRQVALIVILAHMGSFVPADRARIGVMDKIFTRVGATDRLSRGQSTFLVEMDETAHILDQMTDRSLVLLDEVGRGTSTFDGLSIAWAVTEYILQGVKARPKTLFATHFHELTQLKSSYPRLVNLKITIKEWEGGIIFLRKIVAGTSERSYGIHAARVAGLPPQIIRRAEEILESLEARRDLLSKGVDVSERDSSQYNLFLQIANNHIDTVTPSADTLDMLVNMLTKYDIDHSTPFEALQFIKDLKSKISM